MALKKINVNKSLYLGKWKTFNQMASSFNQMASSFNIDNQVNIVFACYDIDISDGTAWVVYEKEGKYYEAVAEHCSCYGLEGQWKPDDFSAEGIRFRLEESKGHPLQHHFKAIRKYLIAKGLL